MKRAKKAKPTKPKAAKGGAGKTRAAARPTARPAGGSSPAGALARVTGDTGRDGAFDFAGKAQFLGRIPADDVKPGDDVRSSARILAELPGQFRVALEAEQRFLDWDAQGQRPIEELAKEFADFVMASEPFARSYRAIAERFPASMSKLHALLLPIQQEFDSDS